MIEEILMRAMGSGGVDVLNPDPHCTDEDINDYAIGWAHMALAW